MTPNVIFDMIRNISDSSREKDEHSGYWLLRSWANEVQWHDAYADNRDAPKGIVSGNWNTLDKRAGVYADWPERICSILEKMGVEIEWSDGISTCDQCYKVIQTEPDCYSWTPEFIVGDGWIECSKCAAEHGAEILADLEGTTECSNLDPSDYEYVKVNADSYESGWHPGQNDNPSKVAKELDAKGISRYVFAVDERSQFYSKWSVYVHKDETHLLAEPKVLASTWPAPPACIPVSREDYRYACSNYQGWCVKCEDWTRDSGTEPDAVDYECPVCECNTCVGAEHAMVCGMIEVSE